MCNILLIEDNEGDILLMREALEEVDGNSILEVIKDGGEASEYIKRMGSITEQNKIPDIILLDINLPKVNGHELLALIRSSNNLKTVPVIMLTTSSSDKDIKQAYNNAANCYITKPSNIDQFFFIVEGIHKFWLKIATLPS